MSRVLTSLCRVVNRIPGVFVGRMPLTPTDEVRWFDKAGHYELRLWSVTVVVSKPSSMRRQPMDTGQWQSASIDRRA